MFLPAAVLVQVARSRIRMFFIYKNYCTNYQCRDFYNYILLPLKVTCISTAACFLFYDFCRVGVGVVFDIALLGLVGA